MVNLGPTIESVELKARATQAKLVLKLREYLLSCGIVPVVEEVIADVEGGKTCVLTISYNVTGREQAREQ